jgi:hypothetical protein
MAGFDDIKFEILYRMVYGAACDRLELMYAEEPPESVRADPLRGLSIPAEQLADPRAKEAVTKAVEDALAGRRPRW